MILDDIRRGSGPTTNETSLIELLTRKGYLIRRPGRREWASDCYDLTIKAEKTLNEFNKIREIRGGNRPSTGRQGQ